MSNSLKNTSDSKATKSEVKEDLIAQGRHFNPRSDIFETEQDIYVLMDMPGVAKENINLRLENNVLEISGGLNPNSLSDLKPIYSEYNVGNYYRKFSLGDKIARDKIDAQLQNGVLTLRMPKTVDSSPRRIEIK